MSPETQYLQSMVEDATYKHESARTEKHRAALKLAWSDFLAAYRDDILQAQSGHLRRTG